MTLEIALSRLSVAATSPQTLAVALTIRACTSDADRFSLNSNASSPHSSLTSPLFTDYSATDSPTPAALNADLSSPQSSTGTANSCLSGDQQQQVQQSQQHQPQQQQQLELQKHHQCQRQFALNQQPRGQTQLPESNNNNYHHSRQLQDGQLIGVRAKAASLPGPLPLSRPSRSEHRQSLSDLGYGKIESYSKLQRLGKGTYATVYLGKSHLSNEPVALKEILKEHDEGAPCTAIREVSLLRLLRHNNIVTLHDICHTPRKLTLVFEYVGPDLYAYMKENNHLLSIHNIRLLLYQILRGISFCHARQVLHRDLKPQNLLINSSGELKLCDFGLARAKSIPTKSYSNEVVTLWYRPPDVLLGNTDYDHSIDMWGVGCIFFEMASGRTFFPGSSVRQQLYLIFSCFGAPNKFNWPEILSNPEYQSYNFPPFKPEKLVHRVPRLDTDGMSLLLKFLRYRPSERISAEKAWREPFFACLPEQIHHLNDRESIFDVPGVHMTLNPGQKLNHM